MNLINCFLTNRGDILVQSFKQESNKVKRFWQSSHSYFTSLDDSFIGLISSDNIVGFDC